MQAEEKLPYLQEDYHETQLTVFQTPPPKKNPWLVLFIIAGPIFSCYHFPFADWAPSEIKDSSRANRGTASEGSVCLKGTNPTWLPGALASSTRSRPCHPGWEGSWPHYYLIF